MSNNPLNEKMREEFESSLLYGASHDRINLRTVSFWIVLGIIIVVLAIIGVYHMFTYNQFLSSQRAAINAEFIDTENRRQRDHRMLHTFEIIDEENLRFRIPIDSAMTLLTQQANDEAKQRSAR